ncbi:preprotein translocase subunit SecE [Brackiella oedipodis]|uniref:preprotein translocase subunit SecE n=1 Tax=Brackiella oedipodis TaxID=124225 RepID=UPI00048F7739|nr:preprotein translocase subunit SecE [Brackiella oedipodis]
MSEANVKTVGRGADIFKITLAVLFVIAGVFAYSYFTQYSIYARVGMFVAGLVLGGLLALLSNPGKRTVGFAKASYNELKRVVWPSRKETMQMTAVVFAFGAIMAIFLWLVDKLIGWIVYGGILGWGG